jgi:cytochrome c2
VNTSATATQQPAPPPAFAQCRACHSPEPGRNGVGPSLAGVFGSKAATVPGYSFSPAMQRSGLTWDVVTLDRYLKAPRQVVPGTRMSFPGIQDDAQRAAVIAYLKALR